MLLSITVSRLFHALSLFVKYFFCLGMMRL